MVLQLLVNDRLLVFLKLLLTHAFERSLELDPKGVDTTLNVRGVLLALYEHAKSAESERLAGSTRDLQY